MTDTLLSSDDAIRRIGHDLTYRVLLYWVQNQAVTPTRPPTGSGSTTGWSPRDVMALEAIAKVRHGLDQLGIDCPWKLVRELWDQLDTTDTAELVAGPVHILVHVGLEDT